MQIVEQLDGYHFDERWLVFANNEPRCLWVLHHHHPPWFRDTAILVQAWLGKIHPRIAAIHSVTPHTDALLLEVDDDRGPTLAEAAEQIEDPVEREHWAVSQIIAIAQALTALRERDPGYVYPFMPPERIFVDEAGHARLRHPVISAPAPPTSRTGGADLHGVRFVAPEQVMNRELTPATEVFVLAINLYLAISGRRPFAMEASMGEMVRILQDPYDAITPRTPGLLDVIDRAFAKVQAARIASPQVLATELRACVPDAADYDAVTSDRIVMWRATLRPSSVSPPRISREVLSSLLR
jgi:hypothetical protein